MSLSFQTNKAFRVLSFLIVAFLIFAESRVNAIGSIYIPVKRIALLAVVLTFLLLCVIVNKQIIIDKALMVLLFLRIPYYILISSLDDSMRESFQAHFLIVLIAPILFFSVYNLAESEPIGILKNILKISICIIAVQVHSSLIRLFISGHGLYQIKLSIGIPLGYSNTIASIALIQAMLSYALLEKKTYFIISSTSLLCTLSKAAFIVYLFTLFIFLLADSIKSNNFGIVLRYSAVIIIVLLLANHFFSEYFTTYTKVFNSLLSNNLDVMNNGRNEIFRGYINDIAAKPLFGWGLGKYNSVNTMAHNLFLQSLFSGGIIGTVIYYSPVVVILYRSFYWENTSIRKALYILLLPSIAHGFAENFFFTVPCEFFFWIYLTLLYKEGTTND